MKTGKYEQKKYVVPMAAFTITIVIQLDKVYA